MGRFEVQLVIINIMKGILDSEVYTPKDIVDRMVNFTDITPKGTLVCDPACGTGNILVEVIERLKKAKYKDDEIISQIYGYDIVLESVEVCRQRIYDLIPNVSDPSIIDEHIRCRDTLNTDPIPTNRDPDEEEYYDVIIMNPPYAKDLHKKFLVWAWNHATIVVSIQPCQFLYKHHNLSKLDALVQSGVRKFTNDLYIMNPNLIWPDHKFASPVGIFNCIAEEPIVITDPIHVYDEMVDDEYDAYDIKDIYKRHTQLKDFFDSLDYYLSLAPDNVMNHINLYKDKPWVVELAKIRGHISEVNKDIYDNNDFATMVMRNHKPIKGPGDPNKQCFYFDTEQEANNFISYLKSDFARLCLYKNKHGLHLDSYNMMDIPWVDFTKTYTDDDLFRIVQTPNPGVIPSYY